MFSPVGDQFYSRAEMVVLGIHNHWLNGIEPRTITSVLVYTKYFYFQLYILLSCRLKNDFQFFNTYQVINPVIFKKKDPIQCFWYKYISELCYFK
jgi:hypothetical protein